MAQYTHIVIAFAVSYSWSPGKNICSETCEIDTPPVCENAPRPDLIQKWKDAGKKIILSFGGAGMGGSWAGDNNDCWDYCFGRETQVVNRLTTIVNEMGLDGVDIDYEYFHEDNQNGSGFTRGAQAQKFLKDVTVGLRNSMPAGSELTHAPMEPDMVPGKAYFNILKEVASSLDFLMPQYYNGYVRSL
ncbi:glycoside hydrolase, partial [Fragilariopsis cylindrus CCMP1102]